jgi:IclR family KDG regulon transcriptional repressor
MPPGRPEKPGSSPSYRVQVLERAIDVLECFSFSRRELSLAEIVESTGLNRSTARRLVTILERRGLLQEDPVTRLYRLGLRLFEMGGIVSSSFSLRQAASQPLWDLEKELNATILLAVRSENRFVVVDKREGANMVWMPSEVGMTRALTHGPIGRVFMCGMEDADIAELLERYPLEQSTDHSITDRDRFLAELAKASELGYTIDVEEVVEGIMGIAAPIRNSSGDVVAALCVGLPATKQADTDYVDDAVNHLLVTCAQISTGLGYDGNGGYVGSGAHR